MAAKTRERTFTVFELRNDRLQEIFFLSTPRPAVEMMQELPRELPASISQWSPEDLSHVALIESGLTEEEARARIDRLHWREPPRGWRFRR